MTFAVGRAGRRNGGSAARARTTAWFRPTRGRDHESFVAALLLVAPCAGRAAAGIAGAEHRRAPACDAGLPCRPRGHGVHAVDPARGFVIIKDDEPRSPSLPDRAGPRSDRHREPGGVTAAGGGLLALRLGIRGQSATGQAAGGPGACHQLEGGADPEPAAYPYLLRAAGGARRADGGDDRAGLGARPFFAFGDDVYNVRKVASLAAARSCSWRSCPGRERDGRTVACGGRQRRRRLFLLTDSTGSGRGGGGRGVAGRGAADPVLDSARGCGMKSDLFRTLYPTTARNRKPCHGLTASRHVLTEAVWPAEGTALWVKRAMLLVAGVILWRSPPRSACRSGRRRCRSPSGPSRC